MRNETALFCFSNSYKDKNLHHWFECRVWNEIPGHKNQHHLKTRSHVQWNWRNNNHDLFRIYIFFPYKNKQFSLAGWWVVIANNSWSNRSDFKVFRFKFRSTLFEHWWRTQLTVKYWRDQKGCTQIDNQLSCHR